MERHIPNPRTLMKEARMRSMIPSIWYSSKGTTTVKWSVVARDLGWEIKAVQIRKKYPFPPGCLRRSTTMRNNTVAIWTRKFPDQSTMETNDHWCPPSWLATVPKTKWGRGGEPDKIYQTILAVIFVFGFRTILVVAKPIAQDLRISWIMQRKITKTQTCRIWPVQEKNSRKQWREHKSRMYKVSRDCKGHRWCWQKGVKTLAVILSVCCPDFKWD